MRQGAVSAHPASGLSGHVAVPGDKSVSHRALLFGLLARGTTTITGLLESEDVHHTARAVAALGGRVERDGDEWQVGGVGVGCLTAPDDTLDFGNSGTGVRLVMGLVAGHPVRARFDGDLSLRKRPMRRVIDPLREMGAQVTPEGAERLPLEITGTDAPLPITYRLPVASAQVKSAVLLAGLNSPGVTTVIEKEATRDHTERMLRGFGAEVEIEPLAEGGHAIRLTGQPDLKPMPVAVPGDPSSAAFAIVAGLIVPDSEIMVEGLLLNETRIGLLVTLQEMGADLTIGNARESGGERIGDVRVRSSRLTGVTVPASRAPSMIDEYPILAVAAAFAQGETRMEGLGELRVKESDRLAAVAAGLQANGVVCRDGADWLAVDGAATVPGGGHVVTHMDHRIAMSFLVMGLAARRPVSVDDVAMIATSYPSFLADFEALGARFEPAA